MSSAPIKYTSRSVMFHQRNTHETRVECNEKACLVADYKYINGLATNNEFYTLVHSNDDKLWN